MKMSLKAVIYLMTASVSLLSVAGNEGEHVNTNSWNDIEPEVKSYRTGENAQLTCHYPDSQKSNTKYLCKGENPSNCEELIHTTETERNVVKGRYDIRDNQRIKYFYVYINNLCTADSGTYWCGSERKGHPATYTKIHLSVADTPTKQNKTRTCLSTQPTTTATPVETNFHDGYSNSGVIGPAVACVAMAVVVVIVLILYRHKLLPRTQGGSSELRMNDGQNTEGNHGDHDYEEVQEWNPPTDQLHYSSINFKSDSVTVSTDRNTLPDADKNGSSVCDYSSISRTPLYSTCTMPGEA
ncbi:CMRF35-like molecule 1 isoform X2 [Seriola dumerili]|uniref:CMRF35-like molecule 1 isoform X2 n=1 Tax=Seriola dumerili TaxID=41447 RepID=UPI000BBF3B4F|nr:CMRF35-like molecule 1 isoform X2 [Seriola dumerili]